MVCVCVCCLTHRLLHHAFLQLEEEVSTALKHLGQHLSGCASMLWRPGKTSAAALPPHLEGLHPLLLHSAQVAEPGVMAPGLLDRDTGAAQVRLTSAP